MRKIFLIKDNDAGLEYWSVLSPVHEDEEILETKDLDKWLDRREASASEVQEVARELASLLQAAEERAITE